MFGRKRGADYRLKREGFCAARAPITRIGETVGNRGAIDGHRGDGCPVDPCHISVRTVNVGLIQRMRRGANGVCCGRCPIRFDVLKYVKGVVRQWGFLRS